MKVKKGDTVHHPQHGIGHVKSVRKKSFHGEPASTFADIFFPRDGLTLMLPEKSLGDTVRKPISGKEAKELLEKIKDWKGKPSKKWKTRANKHQAAIERGDPFEYAKIYKGLTQLEAEGNLRAQDRQHLNQSINLLVDELSHVLDKSPKKAQELLVKAGRAE